MSSATAHVRIAPVGALSPAVWDEVWQLTCRFYETERTYVEAKLRAHQQLALFRSAADGSLVGMAAINLREFWPRHDRQTPAWEAALMDHYGQLKYGSAWRGGLVANSPQKRLLPQTALLSADLLQNPNLAFFARVNPGHADGDMLLCLIPLTFGNWWGIVSHAAGRVWRRRP